MVLIVVLNGIVLPRIIFIAYCAIETIAIFDKFKLICYVTRLDFFTNLIGLNGFVNKLKRYQFDKNPDNNIVQECCFCMKYKIKKLPFEQ